MAFLIGASTAFFAVFALHILIWREQRTRFQTVLGIIMAVWAAWNLKDIVLTFPGMYNDEVLNWVMLIDGWSALTYMVLVFETVMPGWITSRRLLLHSLPFGIFTLLYIVWPSEWVIYAYAVFLWFYAWGIVGMGYVKMKRYLAYVRSNFSNIDNIDVSWLKPVFYFAIVSQLAWLATSMIANVAIDIVYYLSAVAMWLVVLKYSWNFRPIVVEQETKTVDEWKMPIGNTPLKEGLLEQVINEQQLYLKPNLTLSDLASALNTNRTYVSNYLSQVKGVTFYDYINQLRLERVSIPMMKEHPEYTLDYIATKSGFASISTFRRAFFKLTRHTPRSFLSASRTCIKYLL